MTEILKPKKLYHFTKIETAIRYILPNKLIKLNKLINMNDPKENLLHKTEYNESFSHFINMSEFALAKNVQNETNVLCFSVDRNIEVENIPTLTKGYNLQRMWAQYGGNHTGICLEIDYDEFINENKKKIDEFEIIDDFVSYDYYNFQNLPRPLFGQAKPYRTSIENLCTDKAHWNTLKSNSDFVKKRFFTKNLDWQGESEYRFLTFKNIDIDRYLSIENSLTKIIFGVNASRHYLPAVIDKVEKENVYYLDLELNGHFQLNEV